MRVTIIVCQNSRPVDQFPLGKDGRFTRAQEMPLTANVNYWCGEDRIAVAGSGPMTPGGRSGASRPATS
jgi:hypothetical protein